MNNSANHITNNILVKGWMDISAITKGIVLPNFKYEIIGKRGGGAQQGPLLASGYREDNLIRDLRKLDQDDIDYIKVFVDWDKNVEKYDKKIYVQLIQKKIEATLLENNLPKYNINVNFLKD